MVNSITVIQSNPLLAMVVVKKPGIQDNHSKSLSCFSSVSSPSFAFSP